MTLSQGDLLEAEKNHRQTTTAEDFSEMALAIL